MAKSRVDLLKAYKANKENNAATEAKIAAGEPLNDPVQPSKEAPEAPEKPSKGTKASSASKPATKTKAASQRKSAPAKASKPASAEKDVEGKPAKRRGRPRTIESKEELKLQSFKMPVSCVKKMEAAAEKKGTSKSAVLEEALAAYFKKEKI